jgi:CheY-like chemotaxis protein
MGLIEELTRRAALALENAHLYGEAQQARREAEAASRAKDEFLAVVSHELRTPLTPIFGWVSMLRDNEVSGTLDTEIRLHALEAIQQGAEAQSQIIDDLLEVSRIIAGNMHLHTHQIHLRNVVEAAIAVARPSANKKEIPFWTSFDPALGLIEGDPRRLQQVVGNLLSNAIKFTPAGGRIEIQLSERDGMAQLMVSDTGMGIEPDFLPFVFDRFSQADASTSRIHSGLGLGLSIVRHLVELHNGKVEARSGGANKGATFVVSLPLLPREGPVLQDTRPEVDSIPTSPSEWTPNGTGLPRMAVAPDALPGLRLLVVDDEPATRDMLSHVLLGAGADVEVADSSMAARQILARWKPDVLISDIGMPGEDGYSLIRFVRALHPDEISAVPAIALTAYARGQDRETALKAGYQMHLVKPIAPADLIDAILQLTKGKTRG